MQSDAGGNLQGKSKTANCCHSAVKREKELENKTDFMQMHDLSTSQVHVPAPRTACQPVVRPGSMYGCTSLKFVCNKSHGLLGRLCGSLEMKTMLRMGSFRGKVPPFLGTTQHGNRLRLCGVDTFL